MNQFLYKSLPYGPINDFAPITTTTKTVSVLAVSAQSGPASVQDLIARAKAAPGKLNYGAGTITAQLMGYRFHKAAGLDIVYVPFKGTPETVNGLLTGSVQMIYAANVTVNPLVEGGKVRALARLDRVAPASMAGIPTLAAAAGLPNLEDMSVWLGLVAPRERPRRSSARSSRRSRRSCPTRRCARNPSEPARFLLPVRRSNSAASSGTKPTAGRGCLRKPTSNTIDAWAILARFSRDFWGSNSARHRLTPDSVNAAVCSAQFSSACGLPFGRLFQKIALFQQY